MRTPPTKGPDGERKGDRSLVATDSHGGVDAANWLPLLWRQKMTDSVLPHPQPGCRGPKLCVTRLCFSLFLKS